MDCWNRGVTCDLTTSLVGPREIGCHVVMDCIGPTTAQEGSYACSSKAASEWRGRYAIGYNVLCRALTDDWRTAPAGGEDVIGGESRVDSIRVQAELPVGQAAGGRRHTKERSHF